MEKIQTAIAKAREARNAERGPAAAALPDSAQTGVAQPPAASKTKDAAYVHPAPDTDKVEAAWAQLPSQNANPAQMRRSRIVSFLRGKDAAGIDVMRTRVVQQMRANNWRRIAITSPTAGCGKSTIALNLAFSMARQPNMRTMLLDFDLRRPSLAGMLKLKQPVSFSEVLRHEQLFSASAVRFGDNLAIAANHGRTRDTSELLGSDQMTMTLTQIQSTYAPDIMICDMPPVLAADDMMAFARQVDCVLIIAAAEATTIKEIDLCERELAQQTNVMGIVLNKCRYMGPEYGYGYHS